jgi:signal transduction histidine kinase
MAVVVGNAVYFGLLEAWEATAHGLLLGARGAHYVHTTLVMELLIVACVCVVASIFRIERPWAMEGWSTVLVAAYIVSTLLVALAAEVALPLVSPLVGIVGSTALLETMAWSEERAKRHRLERLEQAKQEFTDMLVHDLRRRTGGILTSMSLLEQRLDLSDTKIAELCETIRVTADRVLVQVSDLLDIRKIEEGKMPLDPEQVALQEILDECDREHTPAKDLLGVEIEVTGDAGGRVRVDRAIFTRVIANLFWNALQHAPRGSAVAVSCGVDAEGRVVIEVANHGTPISPERQALMFDAFVSWPSAASDEAMGSTGLGLAFCKLAVEAHGGTIHVASPWQEADGVKIVVTLPAPDATVHA